MIAPEPSESELFTTIEYDMDEQGNVYCTRERWRRNHWRYTTTDEVWLQIYNKERKKENLGLISGELFEAIIDQLEKEWFNLVSCQAQICKHT